jgi:hypothetical protein
MEFVHNTVPVTGRILNFWHQKSTTANMQFDAEKSVHPLKLSVNIMQSNGQPLQSWVFAEYCEHLILAPK